MPVLIRQVTRTEKGLGRLELVQWMNTALSTDYANVQECADGVAYCQLIDSILPGKVPLHKLNFNSKHYEDNVKNLRVLDNTLCRFEVNKTLDIESLAKGRFKENNEMLQWCYTFIQKNCPDAPSKYPALERRMEAQSRRTLGISKGTNGAAGPGSPIPSTLQQNLVPNEAGFLPVGPSPQKSGPWVSGHVSGIPRYSDMASASTPSLPSTSATSSPHRPPRPNTSNVNPAQTKERWHEDGEGPGRSSGVERRGHRGARSGRRSGESTPGDYHDSSQGVSRKKQELENLVKFLEEELTGRLHRHMQKQAEVRLLEGERDFYLSKLHAVEELCNTESRDPLSQQTLHMLSTRG